MHSTALTRLDRYRLLGRSGLRVSPLCLGTMTFGQNWGWGADKAASRGIFDAYVNRGGNFIDTADFYTDGTAETLLGEFIGSDRDSLVLGTKYTLNTRHGDPNAGGNHRKNMMRSLDASLKRLRTDYIDIFWLHAWDFTTAIEDVLRAFDDLVRAGKVLHIGVSNAPAWKIAQANVMADLKNWTPFTALQVEYNLVTRDAERDLLPMAQELGIAVLPWSPLAGGILTGKYSSDDLHRLRSQSPQPWFGLENRALSLDERRLRIVAVVKAIADELDRTPAQVALNWLLLRKCVVSLIPGARTGEQLEGNLKALDFRLDGEHAAWLEEVSAIDLGCPHDDIQSREVRQLIAGGTCLDPWTEGDDRGASGRCGGCPGLDRCDQRKETPPAPERAAA
jgi:aryl-alcohol dehydrogenase-like predicted oxidoreductase